MGALASAVPARARVPQCSPKEAGGKLELIAKINSRLVCFHGKLGGLEGWEPSFLKDINLGDISSGFVPSVTLIPAWYCHQREFSVSASGHTGACKNTGEISPSDLISVLAPQREELIFLGESTMWYKGKCYDG